MSVELGVERVELGMVTYDSSVIFGSSGGASVLNRDVRARRQAPPRATLLRSLGLSGENCAGSRLDSTTKEEGDRMSTGGEETDRTHPERELLFVCKHRKLRGAFCFFGRGRRGTDWN